jgi:hypothetical protein
MTDKKKPYCVYVHKSNGQPILWYVDREDGKWTSSLMVFRTFEEAKVRCDDLNNPPIYTNERVYP